MESMVNKWTLFYADGSIVTGIEPFDTPMYGLVAVMQDDAEIDNIVLVGDHFTFHSGRWWNHDLCGLIDTLTNFKVEAYRLGRYIPEPEYRGLIANIKTMTGKCSWKNHERKVK